MNSLVRRLGFVFLGCLTVGIVGCFSSQVLADNNVTIDIGVGDTSLTIEGKTAPNAFVRVREAGVTIGTTQSDVSGNYSLDLLAQVAGVHQYSITSKDTAGRTTNAAEVFLSLTEHVHNQATVFLPPAFIVPATVVYGQNVTIAGSSVPTATVVLTIDGHNMQTTASTTGSWNYSQASDSLGAGQHSVFVHAVNVTSATSYSSGLHNFEVLASGIPVPPIASQNPPSSVAARPTTPHIAIPTPGSQVLAGMSEVKGTAQPGRIVKLYNGQQLIGSTVADASGHWVIQVSLEVAAYQLSIVACDSNDVCSKPSSPIIITVVPGAFIPTFAIGLEKYTLQASPGQPTHLRIRNNKTGQYQLKIIWGDGYSQTIGSSETVTEVAHTYQTVGNFAGTVWAERNGEVSVVSFVSMITNQNTLSQGVLIVSGVLAAALTVVAVTATTTILIVGSPAAASQWWWQVLLRILRRG